MKKVRLIYGNVVNESIKIAQKMKEYSNKNIEELKKLFSENWIRRAKERLGLIKKNNTGMYQLMMVLYLLNELKNFKKRLNNY